MLAEKVLGPRDLLHLALPAADKERGAGRLRSAAGRSGCMPMGQARQLYKNNTLGAQKLHKSSKSGRGGLAAVMRCATSRTLCTQCACLHLDLHRDPPGSVLGRPT